MIKKKPDETEKIFYIVLLNDDVGGAERVALNYAAYLSELDKSKVILCYLDKRKYSQPLIVHENINIWYGSFKYKALSSVELAWKIKVGKVPELIYTTHILSNSIFSLFRKLKVINTKFLVGRESTVASDRFTGVKRFIIDVLYKLYGGHDLLICQTNYMKEKLLGERNKEIARKCEVILNPINPDAFKVERKNHGFHSDNKEVKVVAVGRLIPLKNFDSLIYACSEFQKEIKCKVKLDILGSGPELTNLKMVSDGCENITVSYRGKVNNPYEYMACADIGVVPSLKEGFPNVLLEMMACRVPKIISTKCADGVDDVSGIFISKGFSSEDLKEEMLLAFKSENSKEKEYSKAVINRTVSSYGNQINKHLSY